MASKPAKGAAPRAPAQRGETPRAPERAEHPVYAREEIARVLAERERWTREELAEALARLGPRVMERGYRTASRDGGAPGGPTSSRAPPAASRAPRSAS